MDLLRQIIIVIGVGSGADITSWGRNPGCVVGLVD